MKQLLLSILCFTSYISMAQVVCNEDLINQNSSIQFGAFPDTATNFAPAFVNNPYEQYLHFRIPSDAGAILPTYAGAAINYFIVDGVTGLPGNGVFNYECSVTVPTPCKFNGGTWGCAKVFNVSTIDASLIGTYNISISVQGNVSLIPNTPALTVPYQFSGYRLKIYPEDQLGNVIAELDASTLFPNPANSIVLINNLRDAQIIKFFNVAGQEVKSVIPTEEKMTIDVSDLTKGAYMVYVYSSNGAHVHKLIKD